VTIGISGITDGGGAGGHLRSDEADDVAGLHVGDVDDELVRHVRRRGDDLDAVDGRVDEAVGGDDGLGLALERSGTETVIDSFMLTWRKSMWLTVRLTGWRCISLMTAG
jgi:hypothetical protein